MDLEAYFYINSIFLPKCISSQNFAYFCTENVYLLVRDIQISIYKRRKQSIVNQLITITKKRFSP